MLAKIWGEHNLKCETQNLLILIVLAQFIHVHTSISLEMYKKWYLNKVTKDQLLCHPRKETNISMTKKQVRQDLGQ
jgi:hypothetical protein